MFNLDRPPDPYHRRRDGGRSSRALLRLLTPFALIMLIVIGGTVGYHLIEGWPLLDALYMAMITLSTVGYGEPYPLSYAGRVFTIGLIITTLGVAGYALSRLAVFIFEGELNRIVRNTRMERQISDLKDHIIVCGVGRTGTRIVEEFVRTETPFVVIEHDPEQIEHILTLGDVLYVEQDATEDGALREAGIDRAQGLIAALGEDKDNVFIVLSARSLNPDLHIIARVSESENEDKLRRAGADDVISPNAIGGLRMASTMLRPTVVAFLDEMLRVPGQSLRLSEVHVGEASSLVGKTLAEANIARESGLLVVAIRSDADGYRFNPGADTMLHEGDTLIVMGTPEQCETFRSLNDS